MNTRGIWATVLLLSLASAAIAGVGFWPWVKPAPELKFRTKGEELTAYLPLHINNSPAVIETSTLVNREKKTVVLSFVIIQNPDLYRRSIRPVEVQWQLGKIKREDYTFEIQGTSLGLSTAKLKTLLPKELAEKQPKGAP